MANLLAFPQDHILVLAHKQRGKALLELRKQQQKAESLQRIRETLRKEQS